MKRALFLTLGVAAFLLAACKDPLNPGIDTPQGGGGSDVPAYIAIPLDADRTPDVPAGGGDATFSFNSTQDWSIEIAETKAAPDWITVKPMNGKAGDATITITAKANESGEQRSATVTIKSGKEKQSITIAQIPKNPKEESWYNVNYWKRSTAQKLGLRGPVKTLKVPYLPHDDLYFNKDGNLEKIEGYNSSDQLDHIWSCKYDEKGRLLSRDYTISEDNFKQVLTHKEYGYGNEGKLVPLDPYGGALYYDQTTYYCSTIPSIYEQDMFLWDLSSYREIQWQPDYTHVKEYTYTFGADGNLTMKEETYMFYTYDYEQNGMKAERVPERSEENIFQITYQGNLPSEWSFWGYHKQITWQANGMPATFNSTAPPGAYDYDGRGEVTEARWLDNKRYMSLEYYKVPHGYVGFLGTLYMNNSFNEYGDIIANDEMNGSNYSEDGFINENRYYNYEYDKYGNWTKRTEFIIPILQGVEAARPDNVSREITYY